jgi:hypothetical protein
MDVLYAGAARTDVWEGKKANELQRTNERDLEKIGVVCAVRFTRSRK